jgi:exodeoxyribonuclease-1
MLELSAEEIHQRLFTASENLPEGAARIPLKTVHLNKCPVLAPISVIRSQDAERLALDLSSCEAHIAKIKAAKGLTEKIAQVLNTPPDFETDTDPDLTIYQGGFFSDDDKRKMTRIRSMTPEQLAASTLTFSDPRLPEMLFRYRARNYPESLSSEDQERWRQFCSDRLSGRKPGAGITFEPYFTRLRELKNTASIDAAMLSTLESYALEKMRLLKMQ